MSGNAACISCPLCLHSGVFNTAQSLRDRLIYVSTNNITCPICQDEVSGLDKLTIHLFTHVTIIPSRDAVFENKQIIQNSEMIAPKRNTPVAQSNKCKSSAAKNSATSSTASPQLKFVKIYPKLPAVALSTMPVINTNASCSNNSLLLATTIKTDLLDDNAKNKCSVCGVLFINKEILKMHNSLIHNIEEKVECNTVRYNCHLCTKSFKMRGSLMVHLRVAHFGFTQKNKAEFDVKDYNESKDFKSTHSNGDEKQSDFILRNDCKQWQCDVCNKFFTTKYFLKKHKRLHTGETPYACAQCNKTFTFQQSYHKHLLYHNDDKPHTCNFCGRAFKELSTLHNHQRIHTGEKPFACETCGKCFRQRVSYLVHRRIHTGVMPYKCTACGKTFRYKVSQRTHKCQVQPPGTVVRKTCNLLTKHQNTGSANECSDTENTDMTNTNYLEIEISDTNAELVRSGAKLSLEDMVSDNFCIISDSAGDSSVNEISMNNSLSEQCNLFESNIEELINNIPLVSEQNMPSPSEILKNLCLSNEDDIREDKCEGNSFSDLI